MAEANIWSHYQPVRICSGPLKDSLQTCFKALLKENKPAGTVLLVTTAGFTKRGNTAQLIQYLAPLSVVVLDEIKANPDIDSLDNWLKQYAAAPIAAVIGFGGGSVMDAAKTIAHMQPLARTHHTPLDLLFRTKQLNQPEHRLPLVLIPTTAGTGSEVTPFATIWDYQHKQKYSLSGSSVYPDFALLDASLTLALPADETLYSGLDALSHALESLWNHHRTPISEAYACQAIALLAQHFTDAISYPQNLKARQGMQTASLLAGLAISTTRTAIAHAISYPLTSYYTVPHGLACSFTLPALIELVLCADVLPQLTLPLQQANALLQRLPLAQALQDKVDFSQIYTKKAEMFHPDRAGNFILPFVLADLDQLLQHSETLLKTNKDSAELAALLVK